jgi:hypothetical protein
MEKRQSLQQMLLGKMDICLHKPKTRRVRKMAARGRKQKASLL